MATSSSQPEPTSWTPPKYYVHVDPLTGDARLVDHNGTQITSPPPLKRIINGGTRFEDPWGNDLPVYEPPTTGIQVWVDADGTPRVVDEHGAEVPSPPPVFRDGEGDGEWVVMAADGTAVDVSTYVRPTSDLFVHVDADGSPSVVDADGNPVPAPPHVYRDGSDPTWRVMGTEDTIPAYRQPDIEMFVHTDADGTPSVVDADGNPIPSPPNVWRDGANPTWWVQGSEGTIPAYVPPTSGFFVHESPDGSYQLVDERGVPISSPPAVWRDPTGEDFVLGGPGQQVTVPRFDPPTTGIFIHVSPDGSFQVVDANGDLVPSPPNVYRDPESGTYAVAGADGPGPSIPPLWPPAGDPPETWPPAVDEADPATPDAAIGENATEDGVVALGDDPDDDASADTADAVPADQAMPETAVRGEVDDVGNSGARGEDTEHDVSAIGLGAEELGGLSAPDAETAMPIASGDQVSATPIPLPDPPPPPLGGDLAETAAPTDTTDQVSATPITLPGQATPIPDDDLASATPIPLPDPPPPPMGDDLPETGTPTDPNDQISATPITLPGQATPIPDDDLVSATPITLPGQATPIPDDDLASATPIPLPDPPPPPMGDDLPETGTPTDPNDQISATPITLPGQATPIPDDDLVSATPITLPGQATPIPDDDPVEAAFVPVPDPEPVVEELEWAEPSVVEEIEAFEPAPIDASDDELLD